MNHFFLTNRNQNLFTSEFVIGIIIIIHYAETDNTVTTHAEIMFYIPFN